MSTFSNRFYISVFFLLFMFSATAQVKKFTLMPSSVTGVNFRNDITEDPSMFMYMYENLYIGGGVAVGDINNDGLPDIYFSSTRGKNKLYLNLGNFKFQDITATAGVDGGEGIHTGVNMVDINGDGLLDIFVCKSGFKDPKLRKKMLYINNGNLTFTDRSAEYGLDDHSYTIQAYFFDYDNDGDKDVFFVDHQDDFGKSMTIPAKMENGKLVYIEDTATQYTSDRLFENRGGKFVDVTKKAGLITHAFGLSASVFDYNGDGYPDIYVANDFNKPDFFFINNKNGTFTNTLTEHLNHTSFSAMGSDIADINNDGLEDIYVVDMAVEEPKRQKQLFAVNQNYDKFQLMLQFNLFYQYPRNSLQLNNTDGTFNEIGNYSGVAETEWSWAPLIADMDNDGWKDIYVTNGIKRDITDWDYKVFVLDSIINAMNRGKGVDLNSWLNSIPSVKTKNYLYHNNGSLKFEKYTDTWMDEPASFSSGAAFVDLDNDGDLDLVVNNVDDEPFIFKNNSRDDPSNSHYLRFKFVQSPTSKDEPYGVVVKLTNSKGQVQLQHYNPQRGFISSSEHVLHFGVGSETVIPRVEITFPSLKKIILENVNADQVLTIAASDAQSVAPAPAEKKPALFKEITAENKFRYTQKEDDYIDFKREPLIPYKCSRKGPYYASGDVNGDGRADVYIGGAAGVDGKLMLQNADGSFTEKKLPAFTADKAFEDMGALFFDADGDKDLDLYVVSGGAEFDAGSKLYQDRLYINDGKGNFVRSAKALPSEAFNGSCVTALDYDGDGDLDLFVSGHVLPGKFPQPDRSMLLQNNKGIFTDVTATVAPELMKAGLINCVLWTDVDGDGKNELVVSGEWMPVSVYKLADGKFVKQAQTVTFTSPATQKDTTTSLDLFSGWWYSAKAEDVNNDGKMDIIVGNRGSNCSIKGDFYNPCTMYAKDFDGNGSYDAVLGYYIQGQCYPLFSRDQLIDQMPYMRKKFIRYKDYSGTTLNNLFTPEQKKGMDIFTTNFFESGVLINEGNGHFHFVKFPEMAQLSNINDIVVDDFDGDGNKDILICGNNYDPAVMVGIIDANAAMLLKGDGTGSFTAVSHADDGMKVRGECRKMIYLKDNHQLVILKNSAPVQVFSTKN
ncbi:MAG: VCBS repeat-containing protein [Bacteroidetes bacterium]|nr:VCBS repeat-containing protein [Bacteroidota bacterium]